MNSEVPIASKGKLLFTCTLMYNCVWILETCYVLHPMSEFECNTCGLSVGPCFNIFAAVPSITADLP